MDYKFVINDFEGPLDLLLHLVKTSEMDIYDISVEKITEQYLEFIRRIEEMNLTVASEYLVMAAELIELKSRLLLPNSKNDEDDEYEEDPRENLINRLVEYKKYKDMVDTFKTLEDDRRNIYTKEPINLGEFTDYEITNDGSVTVEDLTKALSDFLKRKEDEKPLETKITKKEISVTDRTKDIRNILKEKERKMKFDYLIVGAGLFGAVFAHEATKAGKKCLVIDKRNHIAGNIYCEKIEDINVHKYGAHIFHTSNKKIWNYVNEFAEFNNYINSPVARYKDELYNLPFNMNTFSKLWNIATPAEAKAIIEKQRAELNISEPKNLEEQALSLVGTDVYEKLIKGYTEKQWGRDCKDLPAFIIKRLPLRFIYDNNYFNDRYQGIPIGGYTEIVEKMLEGSQVELGVDYFEFKKLHPDIAEKTIYTGMIDEYFDFKLGHLEYRTVRFETEVLDTDNYQGNAVVNYTEREVPYTRIIEHKHFEFGNQPKTVISKEYSSEWKPGIEPYYPINDETNGKLFEQYKELADKEENVIFGGRLGNYKYYDMDKVIEAALDCAEKELA